MFKTLLLTCAFAFSAVPAAASNLPDYPFVHASGEAFLHVIPDLGEIDFEISACDADTAAASALVQARADAVRALIAAQGGAAADGVVHDPRKEMRKADNADPAAAPAYEIRSSVHINVRDLGQWRSVVQALLEMPNVDHFSTSFGMRDRAKLELELVAQAIKDAQRRAEGMAAGLGRHLGPVTAVSSGQLRNLSTAIGLVPSETYRYVAPPPNTDAREFTTINTVKMSQTVDAVFRLK